MHSPALGAARPAPHAHEATSNPVILLRSRAVLARDLGNAARRPRCVVSLSSATSTAGPVSQGHGLPTVASISRQVQQARTESSSATTAVRRSRTHCTTPNTGNAIGGPAEAQQEPGPQVHEQRRFMTTASRRLHGSARALIRHNLNIAPQLYYKGAYTSPRHPNCNVPDPRSKTEVQVPAESAQSHIVCCQFHGTEAYP